MTSLPAAREPAVNMNYSTEYKYALNTMGTYPSWVYWIWSALKDVGCKDTILTTGLPTDGKAHCQVLSHIADEMIMVLIDKSAFMMWAALKKQHTKRMKYKKIQMITELWNIRQFRWSQNFAPWMLVHMQLCSNVWIASAYCVQALQGSMKPRSRLPIVLEWAAIGITAVA